MADDCGMPNAIVAHAALDDPAVETLLAAHAARRNVRGVRHIINWHVDPKRTYSRRDVTQDEAWQRGFGLLAKHGLSFDLQAYPGQFATLAGLIARHPETPVIVNHAGMGIDGVADWRAGMRTLAALPNVAVKLSGMGFVWRPLDPAAIRDRVRQAIDLFGTGRAIFASDFPTDRLFGSFDRTVGVLAEAVDDLPEAERRAMFAGNANRIYRLGLDV
jgi:predicted TIM-barrel fold metal-dependent hydrolase